MYSLVNVDGVENKKAKGLNKTVAKNTRHKEFADVLFNEKTGKTHNQKKANYIELELMMFAKFLCLVLMIKDTY